MVSWGVAGPGHHGYRSPRGRLGRPALELGPDLGHQRPAPITRYVALRDRVRLARVGATSPTEGSLVDTDVVRGRTYRYQVKALSAAGASKGSQAVLVTVP